MAKSRRGRSQRPESDWLFALPPFLRNWLVRAYVAWGHFRVLAPLFFIDVVALSLVRRGNSGAVVIIKHDALGDYVLFRNFLPAIRRDPAFRGRPLVFCGNAAVRAMAETFDRDLVDEFIWIEYPKGQIRPWQRFQLLRRLKRLGAEFALHPSYWRNLVEADSLVRATGAPVRIGWQVPPDPPIWSEKTGWVDWNPLFIQGIGDRCYTRLLPTPPAMFEFKRNRLYFQSVLQDPLLPDRPVLTPAPVDLPPLPARFALFLPGAGHAVKEWPAENYGWVARHIFDRYGLSIVVTGAARDAGKARCIGETAGLPVVDLTGRLDLRQLVALVARAELVLANDSGGIHLAAALGRKGVGVAVAAGLIAFHPYPPEINETVRFVYPPAIRDAPSHEAYLGSAPRSKPIPIADVEVDSVLKTIDDLLKKNDG